jgi:hypothetical protein
VPGAPEDLSGEAAGHTASACRVAGDRYSSRSAQGIADDPLGGWLRGSSASRRHGLTSDARLGFEPMGERPQGIVAHFDRMEQRVTRGLHESGGGGLEDSAYSYGKAARSA